MKTSPFKNMTHLVGVCRTFYINAGERKKKHPRRRPCFVAFAGGGRTLYRSKRFMIDTLGQCEALNRARTWRIAFAGRDSTQIRACDSTRRAKRK